MIASVISTKGGVGKTTVTANFGGLLADSGYRVLFVDLDSQPTLSSYYDLVQAAPGGIYELIALSDTHPNNIISKTNLPGLDVIVSNDYNSQLPQLLHSAPDGRYRLAHLLGKIKKEQNYDFVLIDTQGARSITLEMAVLASDLAISPITPELLSAREFVRGTIGLLQDLDSLSQYTNFKVPPVKVLINRIDETADSKSIVLNLKEMLSEDEHGIAILNSTIKAGVAFRQAASAGVPVHRFEPKKPYGRKTPSALEQIESVVNEIWPDITVDSNKEVGNVKTSIR